MFRLIAVVFLVLTAQTTAAAPRDDADFFMTHFIGKNSWDRIDRYSKGGVAYFYRQAFLDVDVTISDPNRFDALISD